MRLKDLTYKELLDLLDEVSSEINDRSQRDYKDIMSSDKPVEDVYAKEMDAIRDIHLGVGVARTIFEQTGKITTGEPK